MLTHSGSSYSTKDPHCRCRQRVVAAVRIKDVLTLDQDASGVDPNPAENTPVLRSAIIALGHLFAKGPNLSCQTCALIICRSRENI
jgi:hypothetical protein